MPLPNMLSLSVLNLTSVFAFLANSSPWLSVGQMVWVVFLKDMHLAHFLVSGINWRARYNRNDYD